jgi:cell pole-organizing protein PopZ
MALSALNLPALPTTTSRSASQGALMPSTIRFAAAALTVAGLAFAFNTTSSQSVFAQAAKQQAPAKQAAPAAQAPAQEAPQPLKQIALTDKQVSGVLAAQKDLDAITDKLPQDAPAKPDPKITAQLDDVAKKNGFANYGEYNDVVENIMMVLGGFDPKTKAYVGPEAVIKQQIAAVNADKKIPAKDKKAALDELNGALKQPMPAVENKGNIDLVTKYYDKLTAAMQEE